MGGIIGYSDVSAEDAAHELGTILTNLGLDPETFRFYDESGEKAEPPARSVAR